MAGTNKFMVVHVDPAISWDKVERNWRQLAGIEAAKWERTYFNRDKGIRYCVWYASDEAQLGKIFKDLQLKYESIIMVEETVPDIWGRKWKEHLDEDTRSDTLAF